jgi:hypothetical protein
MDCEHETGLFIIHEESFPVPEGDSNAIAGVAVSSFAFPLQHLPCLCETLLTVESLSIEQNAELAICLQLSSTGAVGLVLGRSIMWCL